MAYDRIRPVDAGERLDILFAQAMALYANANRKKGKQPYKVEKFLPPWWKRPRRKMSAEAIWTAFAGPNGPKLNE